MDSLIQMTLFLAGVALILFGCAVTVVRVEMKPDGTCIGNYWSSKEQIGFEAVVCGGSVKVDKAGTLESVVASQSAIIQKLLKSVP
jgi:hypothetical protein